MDLEDVVLFVVERMILELNKIIEIIILKRLDIFEGSYVFFNQFVICNNQYSVLNLFDLDDVVCFDVIFFLCLFQLIISIYDDISMYVFQLVK